MDITNIDRSTTIYVMPVCTRELEHICKARLLHLAFCITEILAQATYNTEQSSYQLH